MSKKNKNKNKEIREGINGTGNNAGNNNGKEIHIDDDVKEFSKITLKKYKKKYADDYDSKKELKDDFYLYLTDRLPKAIEFLVKFGYLKQEPIPEIKDSIFSKLTDEGYVKFLKKLLKNGDKIENIKLLPIIIKEIVEITNKFNTEQLAANPNAEVADVSDLIELSQIIMKKKLKKFEKEGIDAALAFDILSVIPKDNVLDRAQNYRIHLLMDVLYEHAKGKTVPFANIMNIVVGEEYYPMIVVFALLERKEKFGTLTDSQKVLYLDISNWVFNTMEKEFSKEQLTECMNLYIRSRRRDESQNKDGNRRYALSTLSETDYPRINAFIKKLIADDDTLQKYL
jgi:hypothetical protein